MSKKPRKVTDPTTADPKLVVMLSSRAKTKITLGGEAKTFSDLRYKLKEELERASLLGSTHQMFEVWINEHDGSGGQAQRVWEMCMNQVRKSDIILVIYDGQSGWANEPGGIGICHAELRAAIAKCPDKVRIVRLDPLAECGDDEEGRRNKLFQDYLPAQDLTWATAKDADDLIRCCKRELYRAVLDLARHGARGAHRGGFYMGDPLEWSRLDFEEREVAMVETLRDELSKRPKALAGARHVCVPVQQQSVLFQCHAVPAAMSIPSAREMCGQPFLRDYERRELLDAGHVGPVHIIACHRSVTESQAIKQLGIPEATIVTPPFGVYAADDINKVQLVFLANCRDDTSTREKVDNFFTWLRQSGEGSWVAKRAAARARIVGAIARVVEEEEAERAAFEASTNGRPLLPRGA